MMSDRFLKIIAWSYIAALVAAAFAHLNWHVEIGIPFSVYRVIAAGVAGILARLAYSHSPSTACLMAIGGVAGLDIGHLIANGNFGFPMDTIAAMAGALWGVALGAAINRAWLSLATKRTPLY